VTTQEDAVMVLERVRQAIAQRKFSCENQTLQVTVSIGVAGVVSLDESLEESVKKADKALYLAKETGRNQVICYS